ncbi:MAG: patatin-like phospholipase family protein [Pseudomonadota bacterium]
MNMMTCMAEEAMARPRTTAIAARGQGARRRSRLPNLWCPLALFALVILGACTTATRSPIGEAEIGSAAPYGIPGLLRAWGDAIDETQIDAVRAEMIERGRRLHGEALDTGGQLTETGLALSGGGADGAFGAGILAGWTERGDRPEFDIVSGVSTGAIIGLFAFLGPDYDANLRELYTDYSTADLLEPSPFAAITGGTSMSDPAGYNALVDRYVDEEIVDALAREAERGRVLLIGTTNLDAARPVIWNVTAIAETRHPEALTLIRDLVRASSAIPAVFPPVVIPAMSPDGTTHDELHVDGGASQQVMLFSAEVPIVDVDKALGAKVDRTLYVIVNNTLEKPYEPVELGVLSIAGKAVSSLIGGSGSGDLYKIYAITERDGTDFKVLWVPRSFDGVAEEPFDQAYMRSLYNLGRDIGEQGGPWRETPPNYTPGDAS